MSDDSADIAPLLRLSCALKLNKLTPSCLIASQSGTNSQRQTNACAQHIHCVLELPAVATIIMTAFIVSCRT